MHEALLIWPLMLPERVAHPRHLFHPHFGLRLATDATCADFNRTVKVVCRGIATCRAEILAVPIVDLNQRIWALVVFITVEVLQLNLVDESVFSRRQGWDGVWVIRSWLFGAWSRSVGFQMNNDLSAYRPQQRDLAH